MTYHEAYSKIIEAYFKDEIKPYQANFCFCGTLAPEEYSALGYKNWNNHDDLFQPAKHFYSLVEYTKMEYALLYELNGTNHGMSNEQKKLFKR